jgi:hypothetical protein
VLVVECDDYLEQSTIERIKATIQQVFPGHKAIVLDGSLKLKVMRDAQETTETP